MTSTMVMIIPYLAVATRLSLLSLMLTIASDSAGRDSSRV